MRNMTLPNIAKAVNGKLYITDAVPDTEADSVIIDSRLAGKNSIFVAVKGERTDGHSYIGSVLEKGALGVICEHLPNDRDLMDKGAFILVKDSLIALKELAKYYRQQLDVKIFGIVRSVGKTSTKELVASVLSEHFPTLKTEGNFI